MKYFFSSVCVLLLQASFATCEPCQLNAIGTLSASAKSKIGSQVSGRIDQVFVEVGELVHKGQPLAILDLTLLEIDCQEKIAAQDASKIDFTDAEMNFQRMKNLWDKPNGESPSISLKRFEEAKLRFEHAAVQLRQSQEAVNRAKFALDEATIKAPFAGVITKRFIDPGEAVAVAPSTDIVEIQATQPLYLEFSIPQSSLSWVNKDAPLEFLVEGDSNEKRQAQITLIYPQIDESTRSIKCRAIVENTDQKLRPGSMAKVEIKTP